MNFAKIKNNTVLQYPYSFSDLVLENPNTSYDFSRTVSEWYTLTNDAEKTKASVVEVNLLAPPEFDASTHYVMQKETPEQVDGEWVLAWEILKSGPAPLCDACE